ncbi:MAG TPA: glycoside hydrolase 100 family protein [Anaerolineae bacterium]
MLETPVEEARQAALEVLHHNLRGPYEGLPRTAGWGYPEPYTRDLMISALGILTTGDAELIAGLRRVLEALAAGQSQRGHIASLAHDPLDRGASDTTPLFLLGLAIFRRATGEPDFLEAASQRALNWMAYQSPDDTGLVAQQPTSDWRDEQWVLGFGLFVNAITYAYLRLYGQNEWAERLRSLANQVDVKGEGIHRHRHEGFVVPGKPYFAMWSYKVLYNERFDLLGNSLAILSGLASPTRAGQMVDWIEDQCTAMQLRGELVPDLPPCLFPFASRGDADWQPRMETFNRPGEYHNGGIWPFICGFYVAALVAAGRRRLAERKLLALVELVRPARQQAVAFGFNEWLRAQDGTPRGQDWQTWSAAMFLYAAAAVERGETPFFDRPRGA